MLKIKEAVIVEGRYDKIRLSGLIDTLILETNGFSIFKDKQRMKLIRRLAETRGIIILTDSDAAGFKIRSYLGGSLPKDRVRHAYIPDILGKEKRKDRPSKEGKLGVEGMETEVLLKTFEKAGVLCEKANATLPPSDPITKTDLYLLGFSGGANSAKRRAALLRNLDLPEFLSSNALVQMLNLLMTKKELEELAQQLENEVVL